MRKCLALILLLFLFTAAPAAGEEPVADDTLSADEAQEPQPVVTSVTEYVPPVQSEQIGSGEILSGRTGYLHPFLSVGGYYTDNLFNTDSDEKSDWVTVITPGIWVALPASHQKLVDISLLNTAPGGLELSRFRTETERRFQGYALYRADIREHDKYTDENRTDHRAEGMFKMSLHGGLSLELIDVYEKNQDPYGTGNSVGRQADEYSTNLFSTILSYQISPRVLVRADYGNYSLDYDATASEYRNRTDNSYALYLFYNVSPKTSLFIQGEYIAIDYDEAINDDSDETNYFVGIQMKTTAKSRARLKVGFGSKDYDHNSEDDRDDFLAEGQWDFFMTPKTTIYLRGSRRVLETDELGASSILSHRAQVGYRQRLTPKIQGEASVYYTNNDYDGQVTIGTKTDDRKDDSYGAIIAIGYSPVRWGNITLGYEYRERDSNFDTEDYRSNTIFLRLTLAL